MDHEINGIRSFIIEVENQESEGKIRITRNIEINYDEKERKILNGYLFLKRIYKSESAKVILAMKNKKLYAIKIINKYLLAKKKKAYTRDENGYMKIIYMLDDALSEINIFKLINNRNINIIKIYEIIEDDDTEKTYIVMEYGVNGNLINFSEKTQVFSLNPLALKDKEYNKIMQDLNELNLNEANNDQNTVDHSSSSNSENSTNLNLNSNHEEHKKTSNHSHHKHANEFYSEAFLKKFARQIGDALEFLHTNNILHRDIKTDNIVINDQNDFKLIDCNRACFTDDKDILTKTEGNYFFYAPECCQNKGQFNGKPVDVWALGVTLFVACYKKLPYIPKNSSNYLELFNMIANQEINFPKIPVISDNLKDFFSKILNKDPEKRIKATDIKNHPWLLDIKAEN